jgi:hypothetical protein
VECETTVHRWYVGAVGLGIAGAVGLVVYLWWRPKRQASRKGTSGELAAQLTANPLQPYGPRSSLSGRAAEQTNNAYLAIRVLYQVCVVTSNLFDISLA